jgi:spermidine synthase
MALFLFAVFLVCASTVMYEVALTRLLSVISWYYLAFVSVAMAMFGMTAGAIFVQLRPGRFSEEQISRRLTQASLGMAISLPVCLLMMLAIPIDTFVSLESLFSYLLFSTIIAVPFFFSGIVVCLSITRTRFPIGATYSADLVGAATGCAVSVVLLKFLDAPSAIFAISALPFLAAACYCFRTKDDRFCIRLLGGALLMAVLAGLNSSTTHGIQPLWSKGARDRRNGLLAEIWNPISMVRVRRPPTSHGSPWMWGPSPHMPDVSVETLTLDIDNDAGTPMTRYQGNLKDFAFLRYDVTSIATQLRAGGSAAIIGLGGGRDALAALVSGFHRVVGIDVNSAVVEVITRRFAWFSGFDKMPGLEIQCDEARSYLSRSEERFDVIQASLVDTWAATSAGSMSLSENSLYTVDAWKIFYEHLNPGGLITFTRFYTEPELFQSYRLFSLAWATLLSEGVQNPGENIALVSSGTVATLIVSNQRLSPEDLQKLQSIAQTMSFTMLYLPGEPAHIPELQRVAAAKTLGDLSNLRYLEAFDFSPVYDTSPFFFNSLRLRNIPQFLRHGAKGGNARASLFILSFMLSALILVFAVVLLPLKWLRAATQQDNIVPWGGVIYFVSIGLSFTFVEIAMMQQLSIFLGHPIYSLVVVLAGIILFTGIGSLASERFGTVSSLAIRLPALLSCIVIVAHAVAVLPVIHGAASATLYKRVALSLALIAPCGLTMGFCLPAGLRWMKTLGRSEYLPWVWALNGAASVLASFLAVLLSMETSISTSMFFGAALYLVAGVALPRIGSSQPSNRRTQFRTT